MSSIPPTVPVPQPPQDPSAAPGLAIAALACGIGGLCIPVLGLVAIILGVIALSGGRTAGRGLAIGGIVTGAVGLLISMALMLGLLLPALGQARQAARSTKSLMQLKQIAVMVAGDPEAPPADADLQARYPQSAGLWVSPSAAGSGSSYLRIVAGPESGSEAKAAMLVENPAVVEARSLGVAYSDGSVASLSRDEVVALLRAAAPRVRHPDGTPWAPPG